jgi:release factor glutamine methyltransferase
MSEPHTPADLAAMVDRRVAGMPLEQVLGWVEFRGLRIAVEPGVFVPRRRSEFIVSCASELVRPRSVVVDLCCGSGALGVALLAVHDTIELHAADIDPVAVACARGNVLPAGGRVYEGDLYDPLPVALRGRVEVLIANVPYVPTGKLHLLAHEARVHEARLALDGGTDGLDLVRRVAATARAWLAADGHLVIEVSEPQAPQAAEILTDAGLIARIARCEDMDATVVVASRSRGPARRS